MCHIGVRPRDDGDTDQTRIPASLHHRITLSSSLIMALSRRVVATFSHRCFTVATFTYQSIQEAVQATPVSTIEYQETASGDGSRHRRTCRIWQHRNCHHTQEQHAHTHTDSLSTLFPGNKHDHEMLRQPRPRREAPPRWRFQRYTERFMDCLVVSRLAVPWRCPCFGGAARTPHRDPSGSLPARPPGDRPFAYPRSCRIKWQVRLGPRQDYYIRSK